MAELHTPARAPTKPPGRGGSHQSPVHKTRPESPLELRTQQRSKKTKIGNKSRARGLHSESTVLVPLTSEQPEAQVVLPGHRSVLHVHQGALQAQGFLSFSPAARPIPHLSHWGGASSQVRPGVLVTVTYECHFSGHFGVWKHKGLSVRDGRRGLPITRASSRKDKINENCRQQRHPVLLRFHLSVSLRPEPPAAADDLGARSRAGRALPAASLLSRRKSFVEGGKM